jgi:hypothetical protein
VRKVVRSCAVVLAIAVSGVAWAGEYDGAWRLVGYDADWFYIRHTADKTFLVAYVVAFDNKLYGDWIWTSVGKIESNAVALRGELREGYVVDYTITFSSVTAASLNVVGCTPNPGVDPSSCNSVQIGATLSLSKYF